MAYRLRCDYCKHTFTAHSRSAQCPRDHGRYQSTTFIEDVVDIAVDVAVAYVAADIVTSVASSLVESIFDW